MLATGRGCCLALLAGGAAPDTLADVPLISPSRAARMELLPAPTEPTIINNLPCCSSKEMLLKVAAAPAVGNQHMLGQHRKSASPAMAARTLLHAWQPYKLLVQLLVYTGRSSDGISIPQFNDTIEHA